MITNFRSKVETRGHTSYAAAAMKSNLVESVETRWRAQIACHGHRGRVTIKGTFDNLTCQKILEGYFPGRHSIPPTPILPVNTCHTGGFAWSVCDFRPTYPTRISAEDRCEGSVLVEGRRTGIEALSGWPERLLPANGPALMTNACSNNRLPSPLHKLPPAAPWLLRFIPIFSSKKSVRLFGILAFFFAICTFETRPFFLWQGDSSVLRMIRSS